ncbi:hypothetical protein Tco_0475822 [Tanacetum coccineum]
MNDLESDDESVDTPLVSPFSHSDNDSDDGEVLNELIEYENVGMKFVAYSDPFLPINIITRKAYNTIMVEELESTGKNFVSIVRDVYVFVGSFTYITDFIVLEDIGEFILIGKYPVKVISLPQDVWSTSDRRLIELENQVQRLMEAHLALTQPIQVNKITTSCEICSGPHGTHYCMEDPEQPLV